MASQVNSLSLHRLTPPLVMTAVLAFETSTNLYLPSLPEMGRFFQVADAAVQMTLSGYLLGFALLGLVAGPLSDSVGRRPVTFGGLTLFALGSIGCWLAPTLSCLVAARFAQGVGAGMAMVVMTALIRDIYDEKNCSKILSGIGTVIALSPMIAPILGGKAADLWGWKSCFFLMAVVATVVWAVMGIFLKESLTPDYRAVHRSHLSGRLLVQTYGRLLKRREVVIFALISAVTYGGLWAWIVEAPFYMMNTLGIKSVDYGYYAAVGPGAYILGTLLNRRCVLIYGVERLLAWGLALMILGAALTLLVALYRPFSLLGIYLSFSFYSVGLAPVFANAATKAVSVAASQRGGASALLNSLEMGISSLCAALASFLSNGTLVPCAAMMLASGIVSGLMFLRGAKDGKEPQGLTTASNG